MEPSPRAMAGAPRRHTRRRFSGSRRAALTLALVPALALLALPGHVAAARTPPGDANAGLLASALPTPCLAGAVLCGQDVVRNPGSPLPVPCLDQVTGLQVLCGSAIVRLPSTPPPPAVPTSPTPPGGPGGGTGNRNGGGTSAGAAGPAAGASLPAPPGVGIVAPTQADATSGPNPDPLAVLLSLSIRDGLSTGRFSVWPWLAGIQVLLVLGLLAVACSRQLSAASAAPKD